MVRQKAVVYGEEDFVIAMAVFLAETGIIPVLCASGAENGRLAANLHSAIPQLKDNILAREGVDFMAIAEESRTLAPDIPDRQQQGVSAGQGAEYPVYTSRFSDTRQIGGQRILHLGYRGAQSLFDAITNSLIKARRINRRWDICTCRGLP